jgi:hypothetical protein
MFSVIFEVNPRTTEFNTYLDTAKMLRPELEAVEGFARKTCGASASPR